MHGERQSTTNHGMHTVTCVLMDGHLWIRKGHARWGESELNTSKRKIRSKRLPPS